MAETITTLKQVGIGVTKKILVQINLPNLGWHTGAFSEFEYSAKGLKEAAHHYRYLRKDHDAEHVRAVVQTASLQQLMYSNPSKRFVTQRRNREHHNRTV